jgi:outer membrane protein
MKRSLILVALLASGFSLSAIAQTPAAPLPNAPGSASGSDAASANIAGSANPTGASKIAVIAFQVAVGRTNEFQRDFLNLQKKWEPKQQELKTEGAELDNETKQLQAQSSTLSDSDRFTRTQALNDKRKDFQQKFDDARTDYQQDLQNLYNTTASKVYDVLADYAQKNGYSLVLDIATQQTAVLYAIETTNITQPVIDAYNAKSGVPAPAQPVSAPLPTKPAAKQ